MGVNNPEPAYFWDDTTNGWRKAVVGEAGEFVWNDTTNAWEKGAIGAEYVWNTSTKSWDKGSTGGMYKWNSTTDGWDKNTVPGGGQYYWVEGSGWVKNVGFGWASLPGGNAKAAWDFIANQARWNSLSVGALSSTPGWTFSRASTGYAQTSAGVLVPFASGELRRTDKGVLIEGARTNLCLRSQEFDNASWTKVTASVTANATTAPDGTATADLLTDDATAGVTHRTSRNFTFSAIQYMLSVYAKPNGRTWLGLRTPSGTISSFNLSGAGAVGALNHTSSGIQALANGWYRCWIVWTAGAASSAFGFDLQSADNTSTYNGDGASGIYLWGAQLEAASFPSSYIPTTTASATRAADVLTVPVSGLDYPLSLFAEFERAVDTAGSEVICQIQAANNNDRSTLYVTSSDLGGSFTFTGGAQVSGHSIAGALAVGTTYKLANRVDTNNTNAARGGTLGTNDTVCANPATPTTVRFGSDTSSPSFGYLRRAAIWPRALTDAELTAVTGG